MQATTTGPVSDAGLQTASDVLAALACQPADALSSATSELPDEAQAVEPISESLKDASTSRLVCLLRHWKWADEALAQFDDARAGARRASPEWANAGPFGAYHRWCALLCGFAEAALERGLLAGWQLDALRPDLEASIAELRSSRQLFMVIPASLVEQSDVADDGGHALARLRRIHHAFGDALRDERASRELELLLFEH